MDWSKAKTILLIALLATDIFLGSFLVGNASKERAALNQEVKAAVTYIESKGVSVDAEIPVKKQELPVYTVSFESAPAASVAKFNGPDGIWMSIEGVNPNTVSSIKKGKVKLPIISASQALLKSFSEFKDAGRVESVQLIYRVDRSAFGAQAGEDTALPYWQINTDIGTVFCLAVN